MKHNIIILLSLFLSLTACGSKAAAEKETPSAPKEPASQSAAISDEQLKLDIGEMMIVGFRGQHLKDCPHIKRDIKEHHIGGVILFDFDAPTGTRKRNIASPLQVKNLCSELQDLTNETLFISIDQEGGMVCRLRAKYGFTRIISAKQSAASGEDTIRHYAALTAQMLNSLGINLNFAPCVDVDINPQCPVIGKLERSFSANPKAVAAAARIWVDEQRKEGVVSCLKHFPGHGSATGDTHLGMVDVSSTWKNSELTPYRELIDSGKVDMIMTAHVENKSLDPQYPASLSKIITTDLLRNKMGYSGVIITDDLAMGAIVKQYGFEEGIKLAILAGADLLCLSNNGGLYDSEIVPKTLDIVLKLVEDGTITRERIHESAERIRALKQTTETSK